MADLRLPMGDVWLLEGLSECKGRQDLYEMQAPQVLKALREMALVESAESSNRIEGVTVDRDRLRPLVLGNTKPRDRSEQEVLGYRMALSWIHTQHEKIEIAPATVRRLHELAQGGNVSDAGQWKQKPNDIIEIHADGRRSVRFRPLAPERVPEAMDELCLAYSHVLQQGLAVPLLATAALVLDFACIHPFRDGNGRVSRLLTLLALYHHGYRVGRYISIERIIEQTKETYYEAIQKSSIGWHEGKHDILPWFNYTLGVIRAAYREFEERAERERPARGAKSDLVEYALAHVPSPFGIADIERLCPSVGRDMVRRVMNRWRAEGKLERISRGRDARWRRVEGRASTPR
jgi:Fic family protein